MDLIYADKNKKDIGIITSYDMDMAFGSDENNFIVKIDRSSHCCDEGYFIYVEGEEYGGIVDAIEVSTEEDEITYSGRTWHGILESRVIEPETGNDQTAEAEKYINASGETEKKETKDESEE